MMSFLSKIKEKICKFSILDLIFLMFFAFNLYQGIKYGYWIGFTVLMVGAILGAIYYKIYKK